jgi:hypothetical protein
MSEDTQLDDSSVAESQETNELPTAHEIIEKEFDKLEEKQAKEATEAPEKADKATETASEDKPEPVAKERSPWKSWKPEAAAELEKLPENVQKYIIERQDQFHKGIEQYKEAATFAKTIDKSIAPYKEYMANLNVTPDVAFQNLLKTEHTLRMGSPQDKAEMMLKLAHDYQIDLGQLASVPYDPTVHNLKAQLDYTKSQLEASNNFRQSQEDGQIQSAIEEFAQTHEHFTEVQATMADLLERGFATDLDDAYAKAIRLDDNVFQKAQAQQQTSTVRQSLAQADQAAKAAKAVAVSVKGSPAGVNKSYTPTTTEEAVRLAMSQLGL